MTAQTIQIIGIAIVIVLQIVLTYLTKKVQNRADKEDAGKISYEQEHGKNLATKDDIDNIIKELEKVKAEVSLTEQRKHNLIEKRNENLLGVIKAAERMRLMKIHLSAAINNCDANSLKQIKQEINEILVSLRINVQLVKALTKDENELIALDSFSYDIVQTGIKYMELATNAISSIGAYEDSLSKRESAPTSANCKLWSDRAKEDFDKIQEYSEQTLIFSVPNYQKHEDLYIKYLNTSYRKGEMVGSK